MDERLVVCAVVVQDGRLLVCRRMSPDCVAGRWELPSDAVAPDEDEQSTLRRVFAVEFGISVGLLTERVLGDRWSGGWRVVDGESVPARLRPMRCRIDNGTTFVLDAGEPRPNRLAYDESCWVPVDRLGELYPWSAEHDVLAREIAEILFREWAVYQ